MKSDANIIELNGKHYDARTGHLLSVPENSKPHTKKTKAAQQETPRATGTKKSRRIHVRTEKAKTLMRQAVKKPEPVKEIEQKAVASPPTPQIQRSPASQLQPNPDRLTRARQIAKSHLIGKFNAPADSPIKLITTELPVQPEPIPVSTPPSEEMPLESTEVSESQTVWQQAIDHATSHTQPRTKRLGHRHRVSKKLGVSTRIVNFGAISLATILLTGFIAYQNIPNLSMRIAAERAGLPAGLPGYQPAGFGLSGPIEYRPGQITLQFKSHSDSRFFQIHQRATEWDDVTLLKDYVVPKHNTFQTRQAGDKTVYIYDNHNITWVENGVWYQVEGKSSLNSDQLLQLAASM